MITVICGTNRKDSATGAFARYYFNTLKSKSKEEVKLLSLEDLPNDFCHIGMYAEAGQIAGITSIQDEYMLPADKFIILSPEYNGSFPGVLKLFIDACSIREYKATFSGKKAGLVGIASGRAGNLRGLDHLTGVLNHVGTEVMPNKLPISGIGSLMNDAKDITNEDTKASIEKHIDDLLKF